MCPGPRPGGLPSPSLPVEKAGIGPAEAALAGRARCLTCHPQEPPRPDIPAIRGGRGGITAGRVGLPLWCSRYGVLKSQARDEARRGLRP